MEVAAKHKAFWDTEVHKMNGSKVVHRVALDLFRGVSPLASLPIHSLNLVSFFPPGISAEVYTSMSKPAEAAACTQEAANLFPTSHHVLYMRGQIAELRGNMDEAKRWYEEALSINPTHVKTMQRLVRPPLTEPVKRTG